MYLLVYYFYFFICEYVEFLYFMDRVDIFVSLFIILSPSRVYLIGNPNCILLLSLFRYLWWHSGNQYVPIITVRSNDNIIIRYIDGMFFLDKCKVHKNLAYKYYNNNNNVYIYVIVVAVLWYKGKQRFSYSIITSCYANV